jgi:signal transduction histidine kinase/CheY-like chemotaxis protein
MSLMDKLATERRARLAAERLLETQSRELFDANRKLSYHARALSDRVIAQNADILTIRSEAQHLKTENTETRATLRMAEAHLMTTQERFGTSLEAISNGIALFDATDVLISANRAWFAIFEDLEEVVPGISYTTILRMGAEEGIFDTQDKSAQQWVADMLERWDLSPIPDITLRLWNGRYLRISDRRSMNGDKITLLIDITEQIQREAELERARETAEGAARAKSAFLANMSHELRTPMNGVMGMADMLSESDLNTEQALYIDTIKSSGQALLTIIDGVLDFSKLEAKKMQLHPEPFDMERLIHEVVTLMSPNAREKGLEIRIDYDLFLPTAVIGDPGRVRQVLTNLVGNAIKFTNSGHVLVRVVGMKLESSPAVQMHIVVEDTGIGIPADLIEHIFGAFNQVENERNRKFDGTGLGLAISRELVELMGGRIWVHSTENKGASFGFEISLPIDSEITGTPVLFDGGLKPALLVSSQKIESTILERQLEQQQLKVQVAQSGSETLRLVDTGKQYDVIIIDQELKDTHGATLAQSLRDLGLECPIVILANDDGNADDQQEDTAISARLPRPIHRDQLCALLATLFSDTPPPETLQPSGPNEAEDTQDTTVTPSVTNDATLPPAPAPTDIASCDADVALATFTSIRRPREITPETPTPTFPAPETEDETEVEPVFRAFSRASAPDVDAPQDHAATPPPVPCATQDEHSKDSMADAVEPDLVSFDEPILPDIGDTPAAPAESPDTGPFAPAAQTLQSDPIQDFATPEDAFESDLSELATPQPQIEIVDDAPPSLAHEAPCEDPDHDPDDDLVPSQDAHGTALHADWTGPDQPAIPITPQASEPHAAPPHDTPLDATPSAPLDLDVVQQAHNPTELEEDTPPQPTGPQMRVLAAEDNRTNQLVFRKMTQHLDIDLMFVENGRLAVEAFLEFQPHMIFMDISMPEMDGKQATQQIRWLESERTDRADTVPAHVPVVALTAHAMAGDAESILAAGLDFYLTKPLKKVAIVEKIISLCPFGCADPALNIKQRTAPAA